jgi:hypothetical protein
MLSSLAKKAACMPPLFGIIFDESLAIVIPVPYIEYQAEYLSSKPPWDIIPSRPLGIRLLPHLLRPHHRFLSQDLVLEHRPPESTAVGSEHGSLVALLPLGA